jgi:hypothetical protein
MASLEEIKQVTAFLEKIEYVYDRIDYFQSLASTLESRYNSIVGGEDSNISAEVWNSIIGSGGSGLDSVAASNLEGLGELSSTISGWKNSYTYQSMVV